VRQHDHLVHDAGNFAPVDCDCILVLINPSAGTFCVVNARPVKRSSLSVLVVALQSDAASAWAEVAERAHPGLESWRVVGPLLCGVRPDRKRLTMQPCPACVQKAQQPRIRDR